MKTNTKTNTKKYQLNSNLIPIFIGTYETMWQVREYDDNGFELECDYSHADLMASIVAEYVANETFIKDELNQEIAENTKIKDFIYALRFPTTYYSPREYNFSTDVIDFTITIDKNKLVQVLKDLKDSKKFHKYLKDNFTSYDGFISFTPDNYNDLKDNILNSGEEEDQSIGALLTYLLTDGDLYLNTLRDLECQLWENWDCNGFNGLEYTTNEIRPKFQRGQRVKISKDVDKTKRRYDDFRNETMIVQDIIENANDIDYDYAMLPQGLYILSTGEGYPVNKKLYDYELELETPRYDQETKLF